VPGSNRVLSVDNRRRCVTLYDPATPSNSAIPTTVTPTKIIECASTSSLGNSGESPLTAVPPVDSVVPIVSCNKVRETVIGADDEEPEETPSKSAEDGKTVGYKAPSFGPREDHLCSATIKGVSAPKMFSFDGVFTHDDSQVRVSKM